MAIVIHSDRPPSRVNGDRVYFAFPSGALNYDCVTCGAQCCRGHGYLIHGERELQAQIQTHAEVRFFLDPCDALADHYHAQNFSPGCFFLTGDGRCRIHIERGFAAKPGTCRLFPFNGLFRVGSHVVVMPHSQLCPLEVVEPGSSLQSSHERLLHALMQYGIDAHLQQLRPASLTEDRLIDLERNIVRLSERQQRVTDYGAFAAAQMEATERAIGVVVHETDPARHALVQRLRRGIDDVLGSAHHMADDPQIVRLVIAMTPTLRAQVLFKKPGDDSSLIDLHTLPSFLVAVHRLGQLAAQAGMECVSYQTIMRLVTQNRPLLKLLSQLDTVLMWKLDEPVDLSFGGRHSFQAAYRQVAKSLLPHAQRKARSRLSEIVCNHLPGDPMERIEFVKRLAKRLDGRVSPFRDASLLNRVVRSPRATVQQLVVGTLRASREGNGDRKR